MTRSPDFTSAHNDISAAPSGAETSALETLKERPLKSSLLRGWRRKCPRCGNGPVLHSYLKMRESCTVCNLDFRHARADDGPAYVTILVVGHLMAPALHIAFVEFRPEPLILFTIFSVGCVTLSLYLLPRIKGAIVAYQWAKGMFGFNTERSDPLDEQGYA
ncbi:DUF983 domain-containing protein [Planktotalea sp.]|uniref:DUF983 domain-containing protein n=1 Tax=Planktotalea sp. TaxID=2029877 RepID=UPI0032984392